VVCGGEFRLIRRKVQGKTKLVDYPEVKEVADRLGATTAQVLVAWGVYRGYSVIPKSVQKGKRVMAMLSWFTY
jgi:diketogulonate reductase-like aldo/keto reductase